MFSTAISFGALGLVALANAQSIHYVTVGSANGSLAYSPEAISAQPGDQVVFQFQQKNHTATQSSFANPCGLKDGGFDSGFMPVQANVTDGFPTYTITVNDTQPIWVYCKQKTPASHCGAGMVFAVNCGADGTPNSFTNFKNSALAIGASLSSSAAAASSTAGSSATTTYTAAYGGVTIAPPPSASVVTQTITLESSSTWTTTYSSYANSPAATPASAEGNVIKVVVGGPGNLTFTPSRVSAQPRDTIVFEFQQKNHTVTQSSFADPCRKLDQNGVTGFDSGFFPVADSVTSGFPTWNLTINDTAPVWAYCRQANHCGSGMVFAVNSDESSGRSFSAFQGLAKQLNGTNATASSSASGSSSTSSGAAPGVRAGGLALTTMVAAVVAIFF
ncbi:hypothetical protein PLICRDRAFT_171036 [Plicaturopsis crispa FD-325 SS-3]|nr:hypothetical protein PLICRDRAFT_171036 [Plicaturopsis crispa FD-325 SS-3]